MLSNSLNSPRSSAPKPTPAASRKTSSFAERPRPRAAPPGATLHEEPRLHSGNGLSRQGLNDFLLMFRQPNVSSRHR
jgi:hypothetical protein